MLKLHVLFSATFLLLTFLHFGPSQVSAGGFYYVDEDNYPSEEISPDYRGSGRPYNPNPIRRYTYRNQNQADGTANDGIDGDTEGGEPSPRGRGRFRGQYPRRGYGGRWRQRRWMNCTCTPANGYDINPRTPNDFPENSGRRGGRRDFPGTARGAPPELPVTRPVPVPTTNRPTRDAPQPQPAPTPRISVDIPDSVTGSDGLEEF